MEYLFIFGRNFNLSFAELFSYFEKEKIISAGYEIVSEGIIINIENEIDTSKIIGELGGTIAIGEVLFSGEMSEIVKSIESKEIYLGNKTKFTFSLLNFSKYEVLDIKKTMCHRTLKGAVCDRHSFFGCSRNNHILKDVVFVKFLDIIKEKFKQERLKAKYLSIKERIPSKLNRIDAAYFLVKNKFGILKSCCNPKPVEKRDMKKPARRQELAISPRLAKILVNLSQVKKQGKLLDPFCGIGVILQEALLLGINVIGVDVDSSAVKNADKNLSWLKDNYSINAKYKLINADSRKMKSEEVDGIATEPELGILLKKSPNENDALKMINKFENLIISVLDNIKNSVRENSKIVFTAPLILTQNKRLGCDIKGICEKTSLILCKFINQEVNFPIQEYREKQVVGREIYVLEKA